MSLTVNLFAKPDPHLASCPRPLQLCVVSLPTVGTYSATSVHDVALRHPVACPPHHRLTAVLTPIPHLCTRFHFNSGGQFPRPRP